MTSRTGLTASPTKKIARIETVCTVQLRAIARRAPYTLKPFAGLYNPYPYGCSLLCNHPTDSEAKELLRKAKDSWATEGRNLLLAEEIAAIRAGLELLQVSDEKRHHYENGAISSVPEELFRRYTETDSRPLTPAPTLASAATRASGSRRCVTPDPVPTSQIREKTLLILDLRRSHSQETISWYGSSSLQEPPVIRIEKVPTRQPSPVEVNSTPKCNKSKQFLNTTSPVNNKPHLQKISTIQDTEEDSNKNCNEDDENDEDVMRRRGKKRKKKRDSSRGPPAFQNSLDPETQVATIGNESHNPSARPSLVPGTSEENNLLNFNATAKKSALGDKIRKSLDIDSYLDVEILRQLRRELNEEVIDNEFNLKRKSALEEALKTVPKDKQVCEELIQLQKDLNLPPVNSDLFLSLPRVFSRSSARFELPLDSRTLQTMTPLDYVRDCVSITSSRKLLYNIIFNKFRSKSEDDDLENDARNRRVLGGDIQRSLDLMMGRPMTQSQSSYFRNLIGWNDQDLDFRTFCGMCALCERLLAPEYCPQLQNRKLDPCHEIETADFEALTRKLHGKDVDPRLVTILEGINTK